MPPRRVAGLSASVLMICAQIMLPACLSGSGGETDIPGSTSGNGPVVQFDPLGTPNPEVPIPNDVSTVLDTTSPTGRRLNIRHTAPTRFEAGIRSQMNQLAGFGTYAHIVIPFEPVEGDDLDLDTVTPDSIRIFNIDASSGRYGEEALLDLPDGSGRTLFPVEITEWNFPPHSPYGFAKQMLFNPALQGDVDSAEYVDFYERETNTLLLRLIEPLEQETEYMVVLTKGLKGENGDPVRSPFPEVVHAVQQRQYLSNLGLLEQKGIAPEQVAFAWTFTTQPTTRDLEYISDGLRGVGRFSYLKEMYPAEFTLVADLKTQIDRPFCGPDCRDNRFILQAELLEPFLPLANVGNLMQAIGILLMGVDLGEGSKITMKMDHVDYMAFGRMRVPEFRRPDTEAFDMNYRTGEAWTSEGEVPWLAVIPKATPEHQPPFPVVLHAHGIPSLRWQALTEANTWAKRGFATIAITVPMHEPVISIQDVEILIRSGVQGIAGLACKGAADPDGCMEAWKSTMQTVLDGAGKLGVKAASCIVFGNCDRVDGGFDEALEEMLKTGLPGQLFYEGRAQDLDGDGNTDHGAIFTADLFKARDRIRQYMVEQMQVLQLLKGLDQARVPPAVRHPERATAEELLPNLMAGDFNADGILDLGGAVAYAYYDYERGEKPFVEEGEQRYLRSGLSFGGISNSILIAVEPEIRNSALSVPGGGLTDVLSRMDLHAVSDPIMHEVVGPTVVVEPAGADQQVGGPMRAKVSFIRRAKSSVVEFKKGEMVSLMNNTAPVEIFDMTVPKGGSIRILNESNGEDVAITDSDLWGAGSRCERWSVLQEGLRLEDSMGCSSRGIASDRGDLITIVSLDASGASVDTIHTRAPHRGLGKNRNTPDLRYFINIGQVALEAADPINYARHWFREPLGGEGTDRVRHPVKNALVTSVPGDMFVPINTQVALARVAGLLGSESNVCDGKPRRLEECGVGWEEISRDCDCMTLLWKQKDVMVGYHTDEKPRYDLDGFADGVSAECDPHLSPLIDNRGRGAGYSLVRFPYANVECSFGYPEEVAPVNRGTHWLLANFRKESDPTDWAGYYQNMIVDFFDTDGFAADPAAHPDASCAAFRKEVPHPYVP